MCFIYEANALYRGYLCYPSRMQRNLVQRLNDLRYIFARNLFPFVNGIIITVCVFLYVFGDHQAAVFLGIVLLINISLGLGQDIRAWYTLEQLQLLTAPRVRRLDADGNEESIFVEEVKKGDHLAVKIGDQVPCDGTLLEAYGLEVNEGLITGESNSFPRSVGDEVLGGSIITSGSGIFESKSVFTESRMARMTEGVKKYSVQMSPIQRELTVMLKVSGAILAVLIVYIIWHGLIVNEPHLLMVRNIGALASMLIPQGLVFAMTLLFAYGAAHLFNRNVLLQEVNATEKLGRIKNLCMDKTGTLTENALTVESLLHPDEIPDTIARTLAAAYLQGSGDATQTITAVGEFLNQTFNGRVIDVLSFSSWRSYGGVVVEHEDGRREVVLVGAPEVFMRVCSSSGDQTWLEENTLREAKTGKRLLAIVTVVGEELPKDLTQACVIPVGLFVLSAPLRPGINDAINFFQKRGVHIRIISGDNLETVRSVAVAAGVLGCEAAVTGAEMAEWNDIDYRTRARTYTIFARTIPEQKEKIIEALRNDGFTAMVGDGANDALAIKKADLGIAMFDGTPATRQVASVVLMNNSFTALPGGVELADSIIRNAEIFAALFIGPSLVGFFAFVFMAIMGYPYQLTPLNVTAINYFMIGIPGVLVSYWTIRPSQKLTAPSDGKFFAHVLPFVLWSSIAQALVVFAYFLLSPESMRLATSNFLVVCAFIFSGTLFFLFAPRVYRGMLTTQEKRELIITGIIEFLVFWGGLHVAFFLWFFEVSPSGFVATMIPAMVATLIAYGGVQYGIAHTFTKRQSL